MFNKNNSRVFREMRETRKRWLDGSRRMVYDSLEDRLKKDNLPQIAAKIQKLMEDIPTMNTSVMIERLYEIELTCDLCGTRFGDMNRFDTHRSSLNCRKLQAKLKGEVYIPESKQKIQCNLCDKAICKGSWQQHINSKTHKNMVRTKQYNLEFRCKLCKKSYDDTRRPKFELKRHINSKKHKARIDMSEENWKYNNYLLKTVLGLKTKRDICVHADEASCGTDEAETEPDSSSEIEDRSVEDMIVRKILDGLTIEQMEELIEDEMFCGTVLEHFDKYERMILTRDKIKNRRAAKTFKVV